MLSGWHVVARKSELRGPLNSRLVAGQRLLFIRTGEQIRIYPAACPHRGADLGLGTLEGSETIRCRFHGLRCALGQGSPRPRAVPEMPSVTLGDMILTRFLDGPECGFAAMAAQLSASHRLSETATLQVRVAHTYVIENAFDELHFVPVHDVSGVRGFRVEHEATGALSGSSRFEVPPSRWQKTSGRKDAVDVPFRATAYSPGLVVTHMGGKRPYVVITGSIPSENHECTVYLAIAVPRTADEAVADDADYLLRQGLAGLEKDREVWESLTPGICELEPSERSVLAFREFCSRFGSDIR